MSEIKQTLLAVLGDRPSVAQRRAIARELRQLALEQERIADAQDRDQRKPPQERIQRAPGRLRGRQPGAFVRIERRVEASQARLWIYVGKALYREMGIPERLDVQRTGGRVKLIAVSGNAGYKVQVGAGIPRFRADGASDLIDLDDGRYTAVVHGDTLEIADPL